MRDLTDEEKGLLATYDLLASSGAVPLRVNNAINGCVVIRNEESAIYEWMYNKWVPVWRTVKDEPAEIRNHHIHLLMIETVRRYMNDDWS